MSKEMRAQMSSKARLLPEKMQKIMNRPKVKRGQVQWTSCTNIFNVE